MNLDEILKAQAKSAAKAVNEPIPNETTNIKSGSPFSGIMRPVMTRFAAMVSVAVSFLFADRVAVAQPEEGQFYQIKNVNSKMVLALEDGAAKLDGARIVQRVPTPNEHQQWKFVKVGGFYKIVNRRTGQALNVLNGSNEERAPIIQWDANDNGENEQWSLEKKGNYFVIKARHSGMVIDVEAGSVERKAPVIQYPYHDGRNQIFELVPVEK